ncbi:MAG: preprotein translocase subunit SecA [bacterium]|nr:preprotein translocase subunit SecA [bacterium]
MIKYAMKKLFGTNNDRVLKRLQPTVDAINELEPRMQKLTDRQLRDYTGIFRERLAKGETPDDLLEEAFAVVRETGWRVLKMRHFDVQLMGGIVLHQGNIAEMKTGEGKTLVATLAAYLNALEGKGTHIVTVNDYLAERDSEWMGRIYKFLGLTVGVIINNKKEEERRDAYNCDITYGTNNEFGFDYLRDNMKFKAEQLVQRPFRYAIVDEVDSILIDEARTPLIISGPTEVSTSIYDNANRLVVRLIKDKANFEKDEKTRTVVLTDLGVGVVEEFFKLKNLFDLDNISILHQVNQALKAHLLFARDVDYMLKNNQVVIVDEFTGRIMSGRRFSDGLHQALEAKEGVRIEKESQTYASVTFQNLFRMYDKLAGMTGTASTEAPEFHSIYKLEVVEVPTNKPLIRNEHPDVIYGSLQQKWDAVAADIKRLHELGQPVLVGTISVENSELISNRLKKDGVKHVVLNAKFHDVEAEIVAQAGRIGAITIATNMAGRGTDILLGGNPDKLLEDTIKRRGYKLSTAPVSLLEEVKKETEGILTAEHKKVLELGGLHILGTERHESRRIDNQLRGRSGRQGDPGSSRFFISLEDDLMKILGSDRVKGLLGRFGMGEGEAIENKFVSKAIENAQKQIESQNFSSRKHILEYDDVMEKQRQYIYKLRKEILLGKDLREEIIRSSEEIIEDIFVGLKKQHEEDLKNKGKEAEEENNDNTPAELTLYNSLHNEIQAKFYFDIEFSRITKPLTQMTAEDFKQFIRLRVKENLLVYVIDFCKQKEALSKSRKKKSQTGDPIKETVEAFSTIYDNCFAGAPETWDYPELHRETLAKLNIDLGEAKIAIHQYFVEAIALNRKELPLLHLKKSLWDHIEMICDNRRYLEESPGTQQPSESDETGETENTAENKAAKKEGKTAVIQLTINGYEDVFDKYIKNEKEPEQWDYEGLHRDIMEKYDIDIDLVKVTVLKPLKDTASDDYNRIIWGNLRENLLLHILVEYEDRLLKSQSDDDAQQEDAEENTGRFPELDEAQYKPIFDKFVDIEKEPGQWDFRPLQQELSTKYGLAVEKAHIESGRYIKDIMKDENVSESLAEIEASLYVKLRRVYKNKERINGADMWNSMEQEIMLQRIDFQWKDHLLNIDHLKEGISLRGYAQKDPLLEYKQESFKLFEDMRTRVADEVVMRLYLLERVRYESIEKLRKKRTKLVKPTSKLPGKRKKKKRR